MKARVDKLSVSLSDCELSDELSCADIGNIKSNFASITTQFGVLSDIINNLYEEIWYTTNEYKKTDEQ